MVHKRKGKKGSVLLFMMGLAFFGMGASFMWFMGLKVVWLSMTSASWPSYPCTVVESRVKTNTDSDGGSTYFPYIQLQYEVGGQLLTGGSYDFNTASSSGYNKKARIVAQYPVGTHSQCFVNPAKPTQAVLTRHIPSMVWLVIPFTAIFVLVGLVMLAGGLAVLPNKWARTKHNRVASEAAGTTMLKPRTSTRTKLLAILLFTLFWNGIVGVFVYQAWQSFTRGRPEWGLVLFLIPFVIVGVAMVGAFIHAVLSSFNPKPILQISEGNPRLGDKVILNWDFEGPMARIKRLTIELEGREKATYSVGTSHRTDTHVFLTQSLLDITDIDQQLRRSIALTIPANSMHSFKSSNNEIEWCLKLHAHVQRWADVKHEFLITVRPRPL